VRKFPENGHKLTKKVKKIGEKSVFRDLRENGRGVSGYRWQNHDLKVAYFNFLPKSKKKVEKRSSKKLLGPNRQKKWQLLNAANWRTRAI